ncbi:hypothetical protein CHISP_2947 [Chitinispirillum alkaliphilum]|nr:hypothetical protein CHISP_2947 [Chitinispirillum alkaliphilum]
MPVMELHEDVQDVVEVSEEEILDMPETEGSIEQKVAAIRGRVADPHMPVTIFVAEFGKDLAHIEQDRDAWIACGFDWADFDYYKELHKELFRANSSVVVNRENVSSAVREWQKEQDNVRTERNRLIAAARIAVKRDPNLRSILREISEGNSNMDSIQDILSLSKLLLNVFDTVSGIAVGGVKIDEEHLNRKREWAGEIKQILNKADALRNVRQEEIVYRNKIIMLCRQAQATINIWLDAVYFDDPDKKADFTSDYFRRVRNRAASRSNSDSSDN